jgi:hypothetical protein
VIEKRGGGIFRCSVDGGTLSRWLELPKWMFDRATCLSIRMAASPCVDSAALMALKTCLADGSGVSLSSGPLSVPSVSGAGRNSCNQNRGAAHATHAPPSIQPSSRHRAVRSLRSSGRDAAAPGLEWQQLTEEARETMTRLMARLLVDHGRGDRRPPGAAGGRHDV